MTATGAPTWAYALDLVRQLVDAGHEHAVVERPGLRLELSAVDSRSPDAQGQATPDRSAEPEGPAADRPAQSAGSSPPDPAHRGEPAGEVATIAAPVVGTFYRRPAPDQPPFVEVGSEVSDDTVVGIVEVMKLMVPVEAGVAGRIVRIFVADAAAVEEGQTLAEVELSAVRSVDPDG